MPATLHLEAHPTQVRTGLWCPGCALPSAVAVTVAIVASDTLRVLHRVTGQHCPACESDVTVTR